MSKLITNHNSHGHVVKQKFSTALQLISLVRPRGWAGDSCPFGVGDLASSRSRRPQALARRTRIRIRISFSWCYTILEAIGQVGSLVRHAYEGESGEQGGRTDMSKSLGILVIAMVLAMGSTVPASAWSGGYGYRPYGYYRYRAPSVVVVPRVVVP